MERVLKQLQDAKAASLELALLPSIKKEQILLAMADALEKNSEMILQANAQDLQTARSEGKEKAFLDRLALDEKRIGAMADAIRQIARLQDPVGEVIGGSTAKSGIRILKKRVPFGVVGMIYEARPNVTADAIAICIKTGNAAVLKGGREALRSNIAIVQAMQEAAICTGLPQGAIAFIANIDRQVTTYLMTQRQYIDLLIPRGGAGLIKAVVENSHIPVIETGVGNCHIYVDASADLQMAADIVINAKVSRPSVCNAAENLLIHQDIAPAFLPIIIARLKKAGVQMRGCSICQRYDPDILPTVEEDYFTEFLDYIIAMKIVKNLEEAVNHINTYGTKHSEAIVTSSYEAAEYFQQRVDAAAVYVNASTRFTDGGEFGFGAEIGISTQKLHARGPMGLAEMTTYKYLISGDGQIR